MTDYSYGSFLNTEVSSANNNWHEQHESQLFASWNQAFGTPYSLLARKSNFNMTNGSQVTILDMRKVKAVVAPCFLRLQCFNNKARTSGTHKIIVDVKKGGGSTIIMDDIDLTSNSAYIPDDLNNLYISVHSRNTNIAIGTTSGTSLIENVGSWPMNPPDWGTRSSTTRASQSYRGYCYPTKLVFDVNTVNQQIEMDEFKYNDTQTAGTEVRLNFSTTGADLKVLTAELYGCAVGEYF